MRASERELVNEKTLQQNEMSVCYLSSSLAKSSINKSSWSGDKEGVASKCSSDSSEALTSVLGTDPQTTSKQQNDS
jgi:hypothetical protein